MNVEIQKKIQERKTKSVKAQLSMEYMMILAVVGILIVLAISVILTFGGKASKGATINAELLSAKVSNGNTTLSIATNLPLNLMSAGSLYIDSNTTAFPYITLSNYNVSGGYEYVFKANSLTVGTSSITSIRIPGTSTTSGNPILLLPATGTSVTVGSGTAPFAITSIGSG